MLDIRLHGTGGQGVVACSEMIAHTASIEGRFCRSFPMYGSARRGAPVLAFAQIGPESGATRSMVYHPGYLLVLDPSMIGQAYTLKGVEDGGTIIVNSTKSLQEIEDHLPDRDYKLGVLDATGIASQIIGRPIPNSPMLGALARVTGMFSLESIWRAIDERFTPVIAESNRKAARVGFELVEYR